MTTAPAPSSPTGDEGASAGTELYVTHVSAVGAVVAEFVQAGVLVLFGEQAPQELHEFSVLHRPTLELEGPAVGDMVMLGDTALPVLAVGDVVAENLLQLGHLDLKADGLSTATMPGDVCVPTGSALEVVVGQTIRIVRPATTIADEGTSR